MGTEAVQAPGVVTGGDHGTHAGVGAPRRFLPQRRGGGPRPLIAAVTEREPVPWILLHLGEPARPPPGSPARSPPEAPDGDGDQTTGEASGGGDPSFEPPPEIEFDQTVTGSPVRFSYAAPTRSPSGVPTPLRRCRFDPTKRPGARLSMTPFPRPRPERAAHASS